MIFMAVIAIAGHSNRCIANEGVVCVFCGLTLGNNSVMMRHRETSIVEKLQECAVDFITISTQRPVIKYRQ